jgi:hypothetical protein
LSGYDKVDVAADQFQPDRPPFGRGYDNIGIEVGKSRTHRPAIPLRDGYDN